MRVIEEALCSTAATISLRGAVRDVMHVWLQKSISSLCWSCLKIIGELSKRLCISKNIKQFPQGWCQRHFTHLTIQSTLLSQRLHAFLCIWRTTPFKSSKSKGCEWWIPETLTSILVLPRGMDGDPLPVAIKLSSITWSATQSIVTSSRSNAILL